MISTSLSKEEGQALGHYQLELLKKLGLRPEHIFLDIGCGALYGEHVITYLHEGHYYGINSHRDLIYICQQLIKKEELCVKKPTVLHAETFDFAASHFDIAMAFSVPLCNNAYDFCNNIGKIMKRNSKVFITHASSFSKWFFPANGVRKKNVFNSPEDIEKGWNIAEWGKPALCAFPIMEIRT